MKKFFIYAAVFYAGATAFDVLLLNDRVYKIHSNRRREIKTSFRVRRQSIQSTREINRIFDSIVSTI